MLLFFILWIAQHDDEKKQCMSILITTWTYLKSTPQTFFLCRTSLKHTITITMSSSITCNKSKHQKATQIVYKKAPPFTTNCHIFVFSHIQQLTTLLHPITVSFALNLCHTTTFTHEQCVRRKAFNWTKHLSPFTLNFTFTFLLTINFV